jgi:hypothetical protein
VDNSPISERINFKKTLIYRKVTIRISGVKKRTNLTEFSPLCGSAAYKKQTIIHPTFGSRRRQS